MPRSPVFGGAGQARDTFSADGRAHAKRLSKSILRIVDELPPPRRQCRRALGTRWNAQGVCGHLEDASPIDCVSTRT